MFFFSVWKDGLVKLNEDIKVEMQEVQKENEKLRQDNLKVRTENKQFYGERSLMLHEIEKETILPQNAEVNKILKLNQTSNWLFYFLKELKKLLLKYRDDYINLSVVNTALIKRNESAAEKIKELQKLNFQIRSASNIQDQLGL